MLEREISEVGGREAEGKGGKGKFTAAFLPTIHTVLCQILIAHGPFLVRPCQGGQGLSLLRLQVAT